MVFQNEAPSADPHRLAKENEGIGGMVQDINEQASVKTARIKGKFVPIELTDRDLGHRTQKDIHTLYLYVRTQLLDQGIDRPVTAPYVQDRSIRGQQIRDMSRQDTSAPVEDQPAMGETDNARNNAVAAHNEPDR